MDAIFFGLFNFCFGVIGIIHSVLLSNKAKNVDINHANILLKKSKRQRILGVIASMCGLLILVIHFASLLTK